MWEYSGCKRPFDFVPTVAELSEESGEKDGFARTPLFNSKSVFATMNLYQTSQRALFTANEANRFMWRVILAHLRELYSKRDNKHADKT